MTRIIIVEEGDMFYGTPELFEDCFGGHGGDENSMRDWAESLGYAFVALDGELINFRSLPNGADKQAILDQIADAKEK